MKDLTNFIFELGHQKRIKHEGWRLAGVEQPDSVAEHSLRAAQIAFILAHQEGQDPYKACAMLTFHDIGEIRIGDVHKVANRYIVADELRAVSEQTQPLNELGNEIYNLFEEFETKKTKLSIIAKDADLLEQAFLAKEYVERGYESAHDWIVNVGNRLKTKTAIQLHKQLQIQKSTDWWKGLKKLPKA